MKTSQGKPLLPHCTRGSCIHVDVFMAETTSPDSSRTHSSVVDIHAFSGAAFSGVAFRRAASVGERR